MHNQGAKVDHKSPIARALIIAALVPLAVVARPLRASLYWLARRAFDFEAWTLERLGAVA